MQSGAVQLLEEMAELMKLRGENVFKVRAFEKAAHAVENASDLADRAKAGKLQEIPGIGAGIARVLTDFLVHGKTPELDALKAALPAGLRELAQLPGVGPKKAMQLIEELGIHDLASLEYACSENRLLKLKGFGEKLQNKIVAGLAFAKASQGQLRISDAFPLAEGTLARIKEVLRDSPELRVSEAGSLRRRMEVVDGLDFLIELPARDADSLRSRLKREKGEGGLPLRLHFAPSQEFGYELARLTATKSH
jgi:DNA polymerase (family 10)